MIIIEGDETTFWKNIFQNSCRKYLLKVENEKKTKKKTGNTLILLKVNNKDSRIKCNVEFPKTFLNNDK